MPDPKYLALHLRNVNREPLARSGRIELIRLRDRRTVRVWSGVAGDTVTLDSRAFAAGRRAVCRFKIDGYRSTQTRPFLFDPPGGTLKLDARLFRRPSRWACDFAAWAELEAEAVFDPLLQRLRGSRRLQLKGPRNHPGFEPIEPLVGDLYDRGGSHHFLLAKAALLNLFKMGRLVPAPSGSLATWFDYVREIVVVDRERIVAIAKPSIVGVVERVVRDKPDDYEQEGYAFAAAHARNIPPRFTYQADESTLLSIKTGHSKGNLQITTFAGVRDEQTGQDEVLVDIDIDEHGDFFGHIKDVLFVHPKTGGTDPRNVYEILTERWFDDPVGYSLVARPG